MKGYPYYVFSSKFIFLIVINYPNCSFYFIFNRLEKSWCRSLKIKDASDWSFVKNPASIPWKEVCSIKQKSLTTVPKIKDTLIWSFVNTWHWSHKARGLFNKKLILKVWNMGIFFFVLKPRITWYKCYVISTHIFFTTLFKL
jgi:hypothetical protein